MKIAILVSDSNGKYPVPSVRGGAVSTLVEHLVFTNNQNPQINMNIITYYDEKAYQESKKYPNIKFVWIKVPRMIEYIDYLFFGLFTKLFPKRKSISYKSLFSLLYYIVKVHFILKKENYDRVIIENTMPTFLTLKGLKKKYCGKYILHLHNVPRTSAGCKKIIQKCRSILCVSNFVAEKIKDSTNSIGPINPEKIRIVHNCIDTTKFKKIDNDNEKLIYYRNKYEILEGKKVIIFSGRLSYEKGVDKLLEAIKFLNDSNIVVLIVGSLFYGTELKDKYTSMISTLSEQQIAKIIFTGYIDNNELPYLYNLADVAVFPSMWDEPAGLTMIEAMACGTPVITTYSGGIPEYTMKDCSILIERDENIIENIAENIRLILDDSDKASRLSRNGMKLIHSNFSREKYLDNFIKNI